jgi:periplasmic protein TonB
MAYLDTAPRSKTSLAVAFAAHGLVVAVALLAAPTVMRELPTVIGLIPIAQEQKPQIIDEPFRDPVASDDTSRLTTPTPERENDLAKADTDFTIPAGTGETIIPAGTGGGGTIIEPRPDPVPPAPVITNARINPRFANALQPSYPPGLIRQEIEGVAIVRVLVGSDGRVKDVALVRSDQAEFFEATKKQALSKWRFLPATRDGEPVESWREMTVRFEMPNR